MTGPHPLLEGIGLVKQFRLRARGINAGTTLAVDGVDLAVNRGDVLAIVGESGSGKSTTARMLVGLEMPTSGKIILAGEELDLRDRKLLRNHRRRVQMVFQDPYSSLNPRKRVGRIVSGPLRNYGLASKSESRDRAVDALGRVGLSADAMNKLPHEFSGGQRQRIGIARSLIIDPDVLICDEPVSALDVSVQAQIVNLLRDLRNKMSLTLVVILHDLALARYIGTHVMVMYRGRVVERGTIDDVFGSPQDPYTRRLIASVPSPGVRRTELRTVSISAARMVVEGSEMAIATPSPSCDAQVVPPAAHRPFLRRRPDTVPMGDGMPERPAQFAADATPLHYLSLLDAASLIKRRQISPVELTEALLRRIEALDGALNSYATVSADHALDAAADAEAEIVAGRWRGPLHGIPVGVKDLINTKFAPTGAGMFIRKDFLPQSNATVIDRLEAAGAVIIGKHVLTEGAMSEHHPHLKSPVNPRLPQAWTGVSSSGSGVATAAGLCFASLGTDTGGSIRFPSTANGLTGMKPTWGRVSRDGVWPLSNSLDHVGPIARSVSDVAAVLGIIAGNDPRDPTTLLDPVPDYLASLGGSVAGLRIGLAKDYVFEGTDPEVAAMMYATLATFEMLGAKITSVVFPSLDGLGEYWSRICFAEAAGLHRESFPSRRAEYGELLATCLDIGHRLSGTEVAEALQYRLKLTGAVDRTMLDCDVLLTPTTPLVNINAAEWPRLMYPGVTTSLLRYTTVFDMTGLPALTINGGFDQRGQPMGFQLVGRRLTEALLLRVGHAFQSVTGWHGSRAGLPD